MEEIKDSPVGTFGQAANKGKKLDGDKVFKNMDPHAQTIGFEKRTVTWEALEKRSLEPAEYNSPVFKRRIKLFKEVK